MFTISFLQGVFITLLLTHITITAVTLYLHRSQAHRGVEFHSSINHFFRFWLWLTTGMVTKQWVAVHRKHHRFTDVEGDPHSPSLYGIKNILFRGVYYYIRESRDPSLVINYGQGTPNDWLERNVYMKHKNIGIIIMLSINLVLFGWPGILIWLVQMAWVSFWAAGVINGAGHWWGYRNTDTKDTSRNIIPLAFFIGGEELHNNHHADPASPKFKQKWFEFDIGWMYISILRLFGLAKIRNTPTV